MNMNNVAPKMWALQMDPKVQNDDFLENGSKDFN
jgi:hypothetical protein